MEKKRKIIAAAFILFFSLILYSTIKGILEGEEGRLRRLIYSAKRAIEKENSLKCISYVSFDYNDKYGNDKRTFFLIAKRVFAEYEGIFIKITELEIKVNAQNALAEIEATAYGRRHDAGDQGVIEYDRARAKIKFKKEQEDWKVIELEILEPENALGLSGIT